MVVVLVVVIMMMLVVVVVVRRLDLRYKTRMEIQARRWGWTLAVNRQQLRLQQQGVVLQIRQLSLKPVGSLSLPLEVLGSIHQALDIFLLSLTKCALQISKTHAISNVQKKQKKL